MTPYTVLSFGRLHKNKAAVKGYEGYTNNNLRQPHRATDITSVEDMVDLITTKGVIQPWNSVDENYAGSGAIFIDFDKGTSLLSALITADKFNVNPTIVYKTLSEDYSGKSKTKINKFRFVYMFDRVIKSPEEYRSVYSALLKIFHMADRSTRNHNRWFYTVKKDDKNSIIEVNDICDLNVIIPMIHHTVVYNSKRTSNFKKNKVLTNLPKNKYFKPGVIEDISHDDIMDVCELYREHSQHKQLSHTDKVILLTNLRYIDGGVDYFLSKLIEGKNTKSSVRWENSAEQFKVDSYSPIGCSHCSKFGSCPNGKDYKNLRGVVANRTKIEPVEYEEPEYMSIEEAREELKDSIGSCINNNANTVYVIETPAAVGKTQTVLDNFLNHGVMAFPNHNLKEEKYNWLLSNGKSAYSTQNIKDVVTDDSDMKKVSKAFRTNNYQRVKEIVSKYDGGVDYLNRRGIPLTNNTLTTHEKTFNSSYASDVDTIFYDEDPSASMLLYNSWNIKKVISDANKLMKKEVISTVERNLIVTECTRWSKLRTEASIYLKTDPTIKKLRSLGQSIKSRLKTTSVILNTNLPLLLQSKVVSNSSFMVARKFSSGKRIIVLSATPDIAALTRIAELSGKQIEVIKSNKSIKRIGNINQVLINTSRIKIDDNTDKIKEMSKGSVVITYKSKVGTYNNDTDNVPYGGNTTGYNHLKGKNIDIAYTMQAQPEYYRMKYAMLYEKPPTSKMFVNKKVRWNNSRFVFYTSKDEKLQNVIFQHIDSEMVQAIERARTLTELCNVTVYSNFVCSIVESVNVKQLKYETE